MQQVLNCHSVHMGGDQWASAPHFDVCTCTLVCAALLVMEVVYNPEIPNRRWCGEPERIAPHPCTGPVCVCADPATSAANEQYAQKTAVQGAV